MEQLSRNDGNDGSLSAAGSFTDFRYAIADLEEHERRSHRMVVGSLAGL